MNELLSYHQCTAEFLSGKCLVLRLLAYPSRIEQILSNVHNPTNTSYIICTKLNL